MNKLLIFVVLLSVSSVVSMAQETPLKTRQILDTTEIAKANIRQVSWIAGHWQGEAFGGLVEEIWAPPLGNSMMGAFKLVDADTISFYELMTIVEEDETLILRLKHFGADLKGWEEKNETVDFRLVEIAPDAAYFEGFTFEKISKNELHIYVLIDYEGANTEMKFAYRRVPSAN